MEKRSQKIRYSLYRDNSTELQQEQRSSLVIVHTAANALLEILNDILNISKIEAGKLELEQVEFSLRETIEQLVQLLRSRVEEKALDFVCDVEGIAVDHLLGDPGRLHQIVMNLVGNAVKFTDAGQVTIAILSREKAGSVEVEVRVTDTGIGIPAEKQQATFSVFTQADSSTTRRFGGTGLGLSICTELVQVMGGRLAWIATRERAALSTLRSSWEWRSSSL
jgi:two-component system sensor histidine kinase/response regulator